MARTPGSHLDLSELAAEVSARPGLIPVEIDPSGSRIVWSDLEQFHCYEGYFHYALESYSTLRRSKPDSFTSALEALDMPSTPANSLAPSGFIFHTGRCGSTLLAQVLARSRTNMIFGEASPHNQIWAHFRARGLSADSNIVRYRNLLLTMGRRRLNSYTSHIVKFTSFNILKFEQIRAAFPQVPALFLFREPRAVIASYNRGQPAWMGHEGIGPTLTEPAAAVGAFLRKALSIEDPIFRCLDYANLTQDAIAAVCAFFRMDTTEKELKLMLAGLAWDAKAQGVPRLYVARSEPVAVEGTRGDSPELYSLYTRLKRCKPLV